MPYIKKLVMQGFKSFARRTEIPFDNAMNVIVGPNGSGKSNVVDALCFVLGRLSIKSMRAAKAANMLFSGNKTFKPVSEAFVELVFDNSDKGFAIESPEVSIRRYVRRDGQSIYKINDVTKTRNELLELLAQAGIDPYGFNIVLQGEIASLVKMGPDERRKIIEDVAGISIYESRKEKSLREMEKTEERLKEVSTILKEKFSYMKNLEEEKREAEKYQKLDTFIKRCKATIFSKNLEDNHKKLLELDHFVDVETKSIEKIKGEIEANTGKVKELEAKIQQVNKLIQDSTSSEQETLHGEIADLKASLAGLRVRKENFDNRLSNLKTKKIQLTERIKTLEKEIAEIKISSPELKKQQEQIKNLEKQFDILEKERRRFYILKSELSTLENSKNSKEKTILEISKDLEFIEKSIDVIFGEIKHSKSIDQATSLKLKTEETITKLKHTISLMEVKILEIERENAVLLQKIDSEVKLKADIVKLDICPLCKNKITEEHIKEVISDANTKIIEMEVKLSNNEKAKVESYDKIATSREELFNKQNILRELEIDVYKLRNSEDKKNQIKKLIFGREIVEKELRELAAKIDSGKKEFESMKNVEEMYDDIRLRLKEASFVSVDMDSEGQMKQRDLERAKMEIKAAERDIEESQQENSVIEIKLKENDKIVQVKEVEEQELYERFQRLFNERNELQDKQKAVETNVIGMTHTTKNHEEKINYIKIEKAQVNARREALKQEFKEFEHLELLKIPVSKINEQLPVLQDKFSRMGSVNLKSLEVYDKVKEQCQAIQEKIDTISKEKENLMKIIEQIDKRKKKSFLQTLEAVNTFFTRNFTQLSKKGEVFLDLENPKDPFDGGLNIIIKVAKGKYFDITSLSGGEKTLVALSLIFAIQEHKPYHFYFFDEIDAALDKHNSELLAALIKKYMTTGQYIIITHNDAIISSASTLYGVSMQENISKVISLKV